MKIRTPERWQSGRMRRFAKPLYGLTPVPRVRIPPSPPHSLNCRNLHALCAEIREQCPYIAIIPRQPDCGDGLPVIECGIVLAFLRMAHARSGFEEGTRRMQCDHKPSTCGANGTFEA